MAKKLTEKDMDAYLKAHKKKGVNIDVIAGWFIAKGLQTVVVLAIIVAIKWLILKLI